MNILFISSGNSVSGISSIVFGQGESLKATGVDVEYFLIKGKGIFGYLRAVYSLQRWVRERKFDIYHAHYSLSAFLASIAGVRPLVVSLMGSDVNRNSIHRFLIWLFNYIFRWSALIVKTQEMKKLLGINNIEVIPNGVNISVFKPIVKLDAQKKLGWNNKSKHILFPSDPSRPEKNYNLAINAIEKLKMNAVELHSLKNVNSNEVYYYMNAADVVLLTSTREGSPNVIKEAMACNCPTVATNVGDVKWLFGNEKGYYIVSYHPDDVADKLLHSLMFVKNQNRTNGRSRLVELGLDSETIALRIISIYKTIQAKN